MTERDRKREMDIRTECGTISYLLSLLLLLSCPGYDSVCHLQFEFIIYKYIQKIVFKSADMKLKQFCVIQNMCTCILSRFLIQRSIQPRHEGQSKEQINKQRAEQSNQHNLQSATSFSIHFGIMLLNTFSEAILRCSSSLSASIVSSSSTGGFV